MTELKQLSTAVLLHIAQECRVQLMSLVATIELLDDGGTVPFIARYRKEVTGNLDEVQIRNIQERLEYFRELEERKETVLGTIAEQGKLTPELKARIEAILEKNELEDVYLPYKPKKKTRASQAREQGLDPLADYLWNQQPSGTPLAEYAATFVNAEKSVATPEDALAGARDIVAERIAETPEYRKAIRRMMFEHGLVVSRAAEGKVDGKDDPEGKFKMYADHREPAAKIPSHRMLAIRRGAREGFLHFEIELELGPPLTYLRGKMIRAQGDWTEHLHQAVVDSYQRLINPSIQTEVRQELKERSDVEAIRVFRENLENLLLASPAGGLVVMGVDPGIRTGSKLAAVDSTGKLLEHAVIHPIEPHKDVEGSRKTLEDLITRHGVKAVAIGNGTGSREVFAFVQRFFKEKEGEMPGVFPVIVSEAGASVYSASDLAREEFPDLDVTVRGAVSIARRLQDPLAELVKIDPKSIGVGQYQHDVDPRRLKEGLESTVESCVNRVGVDLNTASHALLSYVAGITEKTAQKVVEFRNEHGAFKSRVELRAIPGFGPKTFEQSAGFLRIRGGENPLDCTAVHPESYGVVERMARSLGTEVPGLVENPELAERINLEEFKTELVGMFTLEDIREELRRPGRDPRREFTVPSWQEDILTIEDLKPGMTVEGTVTNVTNFGAFVDVGVHQDGLVHISELSHKFVKDPNEVVKVGQTVKVAILSADAVARRISLTMKLEPAPARPAPAAKVQPKPQVRTQANAQGKPQGRPQGRPQPQPRPPKPQLTLEESIAALADKFKRR
jgi:uncharacterized protein